MASDIAIIHGEYHVVTQCGTCGVWHTVPEIVWDTQKREGGYHCCPNGHSRGWKTGTEQEEQDRIRRERDRLKQEAARLQDEISSERKRAKAAEEKTRKLQKRASAGVCPCCNRTFKNMQRHMKTKHPNVVSLDQKTA